MAVTLDREQTELVRQFKREARERGYTGRKRRKFVNSATATGLVEDNLHNSADVRDHDSKNWRQERAQGYADDWARSGGPLNIRASVDRYANEFESFYAPNVSAGELSARIQRPAAQYRRRYADVMGQANAIRKAVTLNGAARGGRGGGRAGGGAGGGLPAGFDPGSAAAQALVAQARRPMVQSSGLQAPAHAAGAVMPERLQLPGGGAPAPRPELDVPGVDGTAVDFSPTLPGLPRRESRRKAREELGLGGMSNAEGLADELSSWAKQELGLSAGSRDRSRASNAAAGGSATSDHLEDVGVGKGREAVDIPTTAASGGWSQYRQTVRKLGLKPAASGFTQGTIKVGGKRFSVQVIFGDANEHGDHIHVGFHRAD